MSSTVLQANTFAGDLSDALRLLAAGASTGTPTGGPPREMWTTVELSEVTALALAPSLAVVLRRRVVVTTVDGPSCRVTLAAPTGQVVGPIERQVGGRVEQVASSFEDSTLPWTRRDVTWPAVTTADVRHRYRRRRVARRARTVTGGLAVAAGAVASIAWTNADFGRLAGFGAAMVTLILVWFVLRRSLR